MADPTPNPPRCEACRRDTTTREYRLVDGVPMELCVNPTECKRHWPVNV